MLNRASNDVDELMDWAREYPACGWGLSLAKSGLWCLDIDVRHGGLEVWQALQVNWPDFTTLKQETGTGGLHYVFKSKPNAVYKKMVRRGIDIKYNGYIVLQPSLNSDGYEYRWTNWGEVEIEHAPDFIINLVRKDKKPQRGKASLSFKLGKSYIARMVEELKKFELTYEEWVQAGMALHQALPTDEGLNLYLALTQNKSYQDGDLETAENKWDGFSEDDKESKITSASLIYLIKQKGGDVPDFDNDTKEMFQAEQETTIAERMAEVPGWFEESGKFFTYHREFLIDAINKMGFAFFPKGGRACFARVEEHATGEKVLTTMAVDGLKNTLAPYFLRGFKTMASGKTQPMSIPAAKVWVEHIRRKQIDGIIFSPKDKARHLNLWGPIPVKHHPPTAKTSQQIDLVERMILDSLCGGRESHAKWLLDWAAHLMQRPEQKPTIVPVLIGGQGTGKGLFCDHILGAMLKHYYTKILTSRTLKERFNAEQAFKFLTCIDEASWRGDHEEDGILKGLTGSDLMTVEEKYGARITVPNYSRYIVLSNNALAINLERTNRRYLTLECGGEHQGDTQYFKPIWDAVRSDEFIRTYHGHLLERDISEFNPFKLPEVTTGLQAKLASAGVVARYWHDALYENPQEIFVDGEFLPKKVIYDQFLRFAKDTKAYERGLTSHFFWSSTKKILGINGSFDGRFTLPNGKRPYGYNIGAEMFVEKFSKGLAIERPHGFDEFEYFMPRKTFEDDPSNFN